MPVIDLHNHSPFVSSDYRSPRTTPREYIEAARAAGIDVLGLTDHFTIGWYRQLARAAEEQESRTGERMLVVPGFEIKVTWGADEAHLIALLPPDDAEERFAALTAQLGVEERLADIEALPRLKVERDPVEVARLVDAAGGLCHVAHVDRLFGSYRLLGSATLERLLAEAPLAAVECVASDPPPALGAAASHLAVIRSSDSHAPGELGRRTCRLPMRELTFEALRGALFGAATEVS